MHHHVSAKTPRHSTLYVDSMASALRRTKSGTRAFKPGGSVGDAHIKTLQDHFLGELRSTAGPPIQAIAATPRPQSVFLSKTPSGVAHIYALNQDKHHLRLRLSGTPTELKPTSSFRSKTPIGDAHIRSSPGYSSPPHWIRMPRSDFDTPRQNSGTAAFKSKCSIGDAHIRALPKPVDVQVAYRVY